MSDLWRTFLRYLYLSYVDTGIRFHTSKTYLNKVVIYQNILSFSP